MLKRIRLDQIQPNPDQPRKAFDEIALTELSASIEAQGLIQPITVRPADDGYQITAGERRWRASCLWRDRGGPDTILCHVRSTDERTRDIHAIIENGQRRDISPVEEGRAYKRMLDEHGMTVDELAAAIGKQPWRIRDRLHMLGLSNDSEKLLRQGVITASQAYEIATFDPSTQERLARVCVEGRAGDYNAFRAASKALQAELLGDDVAPRSSAADRRSLSALEAKITKTTEIFAEAFSEGEIVAAQRVDPNRATTLADEIALIRKHLLDIEEQLRAAAIVSEVAGAADVAA